MGGGPETPMRRVRGAAASCAWIALAALGACGGGGGGGYGGSSGGGSGGAGGGGFVATPPPPVTGAADLGPGADLHGRRPFPDDDPWNVRVDAAEVDPASDTLIASIGLATHLHPDFGADWDGGPFGIPYTVVDASQRKVDVGFEWPDESDPPPYPIPPDAPIEGGAASTGDRHVLVVDKDAWTLYELFAAYPRASGGGWDAGSGAFFDLSLHPARPQGWTSADAAGLPIFPGLVRYDEVVGQGEIRHAIRFTVSRTRRAYVAPATHWASSDRSVSLPPMGMRVRLKAGYDVSTFPPQSRVVLTAMKRYGMFVADNGSDWYVSGAPDARWDDGDLNALKGVPGSAFEVVRMGTVVHD
jgi:hypothetical protein